MAVGLEPARALLPVKGVRLGTAQAGVRYQGRTDLALIELAPGSTTAATFTQNSFEAAPVTLARQHLSTGTSRYWLINSGNANAATGSPGIADALATCEMVGRAGTVPATAVLPFSTGVIGERMPLAAFEHGVPAAFAALAEDGWMGAAEAIMTTDTVPKGASREVTLSDGACTITGIVKGSGMIRPDMATMLAFVATDAAIAADDLQSMLRNAVEFSFNRVTVDGDTSTNDACVLAATGASGVGLAAAADRQQFVQVLQELMLELAQSLVRDGEGATKFIAVEVTGGADATESLRVAYTVAHSPLVKTAIFASDPNWGRIVMAIGRAGVRDLDVSGVHVHLGDVCIVRNGGRAEDYTEEAGQRVMDEEEILVRIELGRGGAAETVWTSDLSHDYVTINAEYRT
ncbi:MAG: bifunctional glutamate N-acetyltransferase/amino-acid acetyltransferase ArgJ [Pseudomonadota bacterium]